MNEITTPLNVSQLEARLAQVAADLGVPVARARVMLCTLIVSQMLPDAAVVKGGMGIKLRLGERGTRATSDLDVSTRARGAEFEAEFAERLAVGWGTVPASRGSLRRDSNAPDRVAFTATVRAGKIHDPGLAKPEYVMHPYRVAIAFLGVAWAGLDIEVSDPEIETEGQGKGKLDGELVQFGARFGFGALQPVEIVDVEYQIAQKIHAVTDPAYTRAHDLVDLQLLWSLTPDILVLRELCVRTFDWRNQQPWPPLPLRPMDGWDFAYVDALEETELNGETQLLATLSEARGWLEVMIKEIVSPSRTK